MKRTVISILFLLGVGIAVLVSFSPFRMHEGFDRKMIKHSIVINASTDSVYRFMGNSSNVSGWSVYSDHVRLLNADSIRDGEVGSSRRVFQEVNEEGMSWDETITIAEPNKLRQLKVYNLVNFTFSVDDLTCEQIFDSIDANTTRLTLTLFYLGHEPGTWELFKTHFSSYKAHDILKRNLANIKRIIETGIYSN